MIPDTMQICVQLIYLKTMKGSAKQWQKALLRADAYIRHEFADYPIFRGRCKQKGLSGILLRFVGGTDKSNRPNLPRVRRSSKYDLINALRCVRLLVHTEISKTTPTAAKALMRLVEFTRLIKTPRGLVTSELSEMRIAVNEYMTGDRTQDLGIHPPVPLLLTSRVRSSARAGCSRWCRRQPTYAILASEAAASRTSTSRTTGIRRCMPLSCIFGWVPPLAR